MSGVPWVTERPIFWGKFGPVVQNEFGASRASHPPISGRRVKVDPGLAFYVFSEVNHFCLSLLNAICAEQYAELICSYS